MSSINLLPGDIVRRVDATKRGAVASAVIVFIFVIIFSSYTYLYIQTRTTDKQLSEIRPKLENVSGIIKKLTDVQKISIEDQKTNFAFGLLKEHTHYSKVLENLIKTINKNVYLTDGSFAIGADNNLTLTFTAKSKDYMSAMEQILIFKQDYWVEDVKVGEFSGREGEEIEFSGTVKFKKDLMFYHDNYWGYGLALLNVNKDQSVRLSSYSAETDSANNVKTINAKFSGFGYDKEKIKQLEDILGKTSPFIKEIKINSSEKPADNSGRIEFNGTMKIVLGS